MYSFHSSSDAFLGRCSQSDIFLCGPDADDGSGDGGTTVDQDSCGSGDGDATSAQESSFVLLWLLPVPHDFALDFDDSTLPPHEE